MSSASTLWIAVVLATVLGGCVPPKDGRPGLGLRGEVAPAVPSDWSFTSEYREIAIEVRTPYLLPHAVTIWCGSVDERLYLAARAPGTKRWPSWVDRDPNVRLEIGGQIYEVRLTPLDDPNQLVRVQRTYALKYDLPDPPPEGGPPSRYWLVEPRG